jgi:vancomycin permeability regulator SanA
MRQKYFGKILIFLAVFAFVLLLPALLIVADGLADELQRADVAVVPGNTVGPDGRPSPRLQARLDKTVELYQKSFFPQIIVSGGTGVEGFDEAAVMRAYLIEQGIPAAVIYADSAGLTTELTARNAAHLMQQHNWQSAMVVSQYFHLSRTKLAFARNGITPVYSAHADYFEPRDLYSICREVIGYISYYFR